MISGGNGGGGADVSQGDRREQPQERVERWAAYLRYSSPRQGQGYSIQQQREALLRESELRRQAEPGLRVEIRWYEEHGKSAKAEAIAKRVVFHGMIADVKAGLHDVVVVHQLDRFARSVLHQELFKAEVRAAGARLYSVVDRLDLDSDEGAMFAQVKASFAEYVIKQSGKRVAASIDAKARAGLATHRPPFGYRSVGPKLPPVPDTGSAGDDLGAAGGQARGGTWEGYERLKRWMLDGYTDQECADRMNAAGWRIGGASAARHPVTGEVLRERLFSRSTVGAIRRNPFYRAWEPGDDRGTIAHNGRLYRGQHAAAATWEDWHLLQTVVSGRRRGWYGQAVAEPELPSRAEFRGLLVCAACGGRAILRHATRLRGDRAAAAESSADPGRFYEYYRCAARERREECACTDWYARTQDVTDAWVRWAERHLRLPSDWERRLRAPDADPGDDAGGEEGRGEEARRRLAAERSRWEKQRTQTGVAVARGWLDEGTAAGLIGEADRELARVAALERSRAGRGEQLLDAGRFITSVAALWPHMTLDERRRMAALLLEPPIAGRAYSGGLEVRLLGHGPRHAGNADAPTCELARVHLRPVYRALLTALHAQEEQAAS